MIAKKNLYKLASALIFMAVLFVCFTQLKKIKPFEVQKLLPEDHPIRLEYDIFSKSYNDENKIFVLFKNTEQFTPEKLKKLFNPLNKTFSLMREVSSFSNISNAKYISFDENGFQLKPFIHKNNFSQESLLKLKTDFWSNSLISSDFKSALSVITLSSKIDKKERVPFVERLKSIVEDNNKNFNSITSDLLGTEVANFWFTKEMLKNQKVITPLLMFFIAIFFYIIFRSIAIVVISQIIIIINYSLTIILITLLEHGIGPYSSFALMFVTIIATADLIHFFTKFVETKGSIEQTIKAIKKACFLTSLTTAIGFGALIANENVPVRYFGFYCAAGTFFCFFVTFYIMPIFIRSTNLNAKLPQVRVLKKINLVSFNYKYQNKILLFFSLSTLLFIFYSTKLTIDDNLYKKFIPSHPLSHAVDNFSSGLNFVGSIDIIINTKDGSILSEKVLNQIKSLEKEILAEPMVSHIKSITQLIDNIEVEIKNNNKVSTNSFLNLLYDYGALNSFYKKTKNEIRTTIFLNSLNSTELEKIISELNAMTHHYDLIDFKVAGFATIRNYINQNVIRSFMTSFLTSLLLIFAIFLILFRSLKWAIIAMVPNLYPLLLISGLMGIFNITMESNLVILISITIGIAVDDTIHVIVSLQKYLKEGFSLKDALTKCLDSTAPALFRTTLIFVFSFPTFLLSELTLFFQAGIFILLSLLCALLADVLLLPSLLIKLNKLGQKNDNI